MTERWRLHSTYQWSPNTRQTDVAALDLQHRLGNDGILNFGYHYRRGLLEQYTASAVYPVTDRWQLIGSVQLFGAHQESIRGTDRCVGGPGRARVRQLLHHPAPGRPQFLQPDVLRCRQLPAGKQGSVRDNAIMFEVVFKGLGSTGGQIDPLLHRDILGYQ